MVVIHGPRKRGQFLRPIIIYTPQSGCFMRAACILAQEPEDGAGSNPMCQAFNYLSSLWYYRISFKAKPWIITILMHGTAVKPQLRLWDARASSCHAWWLSSVWIEHLLSYNIIIVYTASTTPSASVFGEALFSPLPPSLWVLPLPRNRSLKLPLYFARVGEADTLTPSASDGVRDSILRFLPLGGLLESWPSDSFLSSTCILLFVRVSSLLWSSRVVLLAMFTVQILIYI